MSCGWVSCAGGLVVFVGIGWAASSARADAIDVSIRRVAIFGTVNDEFVVCRLCGCGGVVMLLLDMFEMSNQPTTHRRHPNPNVAIPMMYPSLELGVLPDCEDACSCGAAAC